MNERTLGQVLFDLVTYGIHNGYHFYSLQVLPEGGDWKAIDRDIMLRYDIVLPRAARYRRRKKGQPVFRYVRWKQHSLILATDGDRAHPFFVHRKVCDLRVNPISLGQYSVGVRDGRGCIELHQVRYDSVRATLRGMALHRYEKVQSYVDGISPYTFKGIIRQVNSLKAEVNDRRKKAQVRLVR